MKMKIVKFNKMRQKISVALMGMFFFVMTSPAFAGNAGTVADTLKDQVGSFRGLLLAGVFLVGLAVGFAATLKFKAHSENAQQVPLKVPMIYALVAALLVGFPVFMSVGKKTLFSEDGDSISDMGSFAD